MRDSKPMIQNPRSSVQGLNSRFCVLYLISCVLCFIPSTSYTADASDIQILEMSQDGLVIQFRMSELQVETKDVEGQTFQLLSFKDCSFTHEVGKARIPIKVVSLGIPYGSTPDVSVLDAESSVLTGYRLYPVEQEMTYREDTRDLSPPSDVWHTTGTEFAMDQEFYNSGRLYPPVLVEIEPVGSVRQQRLARLELHPIQYTPFTGQLKVYETLVIRVKFPMSDDGVQSSILSVHAAPGFQSPASDPRHSERVFEDLYRDTLLNYEQAKIWRKPRPSVMRSLAPSLEPEVSYKITIERDGIYKLTHSYLASVGIDLTTIDPRKIELRCGGERIPIYMEGYKDGKFDPGDFIEFYGRKMDSIYTNTNVYWLTWSSLGSSGTKSWMMVTKDGAPKERNLTPPTSFLATEHWELESGEGISYDPLKAVDSELADHFFWKAMRGQDPKNDSTIIPIAIDLPFRTPVLYNTYELRVCFQGLTYARGANTHKVDIILNGEVVDTAQWEGQTEYISEVVLPHIKLRRNNWLNLHCLDDNGTLEKYASDSSALRWDLYLNWIEMDYWRDFTADANKLEFSTTTLPAVTRTVQYKVTHFSTPDIEVFQIDGSGAIAKIINPQVEKDGTFYSVLFEDRVNQPTRYFVVGSVALMRPSSMVKDVPSTLHDPANRVDYIMITHKDFRDSTERLADFRRKQGLSVLVVDIEDIYDEFSYGVFDPKAIKRFLRYAYWNWDKEPVYVLLMGDAHWDYKYVYDVYYKRYDNYPRIYVPTYHAQSSPYGQAALDHRFVTVSGDDRLPDMFIGRIPVETEYEANIAVGKIIKYEQNPNRGLWQSRVVLVSDDKKSKSGDEIFQESREELANEYIPVGYEVAKVYLEWMEAYLAKDMISKEINSDNKGAVILEYAGHGGAYHWAHEGIFSWEDVLKLRNYDRYPFVITTTCDNGYFDSPMGGNKCIMEQFLLRPNAGAIACLSATRLTFGQGNAVFDKILYPKIFNEKPPILGKIMTEAKIEFIILGIATWIPSAEQYTLLGDPATVLALPELNVECSIEKSSVDSSKKLEVKPGSIKRMRDNPVTGEKELITDTGFNAQMQVSVIYPNNFDRSRDNDLSVQKQNINVWKGEFGTTQLSIPRSAIPGEGHIKFYASDGNTSAIGGVRFSVRKPVIEFYSSKMVNDESLQVYAAVVDNLGSAGIKLVECKWKNTETWKPQTSIMIPGEAPPDAPEIEGLWYVLEDNIPLSRPGTAIIYSIKVMDTENNEVISAESRVEIPVGINLAISRLDLSQSPIISYSYSQDEGAWMLSAPVENNGGKPVTKPVVVYFCEGSPDRNRDNMIDSNAEILGNTIIEPDQWQPGEHAIQIAEASVKLDERLYSGFHQIFVWINPKTKRLEDQPPVERVEDANSDDDRASRLFPINEFLVGKDDEEAVSQSLDGTLSMVIPPGAVDETVMSITRLTLPEAGLDQPDLTIAPIPEYGLDGEGFKVQLASGVVSLRKEAQIDIKFDYMKIRELAKEAKGLAGKRENELSAAERGWIETACQEEAGKLGIYAWQEDMEIWRYMPSTILMDEEGKEIAQESYVTLPVSENTPGVQLDFASISVDEILTPLGQWVVFLLNADKYKVYLRREGMDTYENLKPGEVDKTYDNSDVGLRMFVKKGLKDFNYGDSFRFETYLHQSGSINLQNLRDYNDGVGAARVTIIAEDRLKDVDYIAGEWAVFFTSPETFEIHSNLGYPVRNVFGVPVTGEVGKEVLASTIGVVIEIHEGRWPFAFGDRFVFKTLFTGTVRAHTDLLNTMALMHSNDSTPPSIQLWLGGHVPQSGIVIPPLPEFSLLLSDVNGVDIDSLSFLMSVDDRDFYPVPSDDYVFSERGSGVDSFVNIPIFYSPILNIGKYKYRISVMDFTGNKSDGGNGNHYLEFMFLVEEQPDLSPPTISVTADGQILIDGQMFRSSPQFIINIDDDYALKESGIFFSFGFADESLEPLKETEYTMTLSGDPDSSRNAVIVYAPHLMNGEYVIQVQATDTSENTAYLTLPDAEPLTFCMDEEVKLERIMNAPNPFSDTTAFSYSLTQPADKVVVKIYTLRGRLVRTLEQDIPKWQYNEEFWDGRDEEGNKLASGTYLYKFIVISGDKKIERIGKLAIIR